MSDVRVQDPAGVQKLLISLLARVNEELGASLDFDVTVAGVAALAVPQLADWSVLFLAAENDGEPVFTAAAGASGRDLAVFSTPMMQEDLRLDATFRTGEPQLVENDGESILSLPLHRGSEVIGALCLGVKAPRMFQPHDLIFGPDLAQRAATAIENARLYRRTIETEGELLQAKLLAEDANRAKTEFLANMSHEIRTPLGAILGFVDLLFLPDQSDEDRLEWARRVKSNSQHLRRLIDDILNLSKVESGKMEILKEEICFASFLHDLEAAFSGTAMAKGLSLEIRFESSVPSRFRSDSTRLQQILSNLIGNALKFTETGGVLVTIRFEETGHLRFDVRDTGPGLTAGQSATLFRPFVQADAAHTRRHGGTGLGLALAQRLARLLGGDVELLESAPGVGSCFGVTVRPEIPEGTSFLSSYNYRASVDGAKTAEAPVDGAGTLGGARILVVDDSSHNRLLVTQILRFGGAEVSVAADGPSALALVESQAFDLIVMDIQMPGMDGYETTRQLRARGFASPIVALTAHALQAERARGFQAGCNEYMTKPIDRRLFFRTIARLLSEDRHRPEPKADSVTQMRH